MLHSILLKGRCIFLIDITEKFKKAIYAPSRKTKASVRFEILDTTAYKDNIKNVSSEVEFSKSEQLTNKIRVPSNKIVTLEKDYFKLDGTFSLPPGTENVNEIGYWSRGVSDYNGKFIIPEVLEFTFNNKHSSMGFTIVFDILNNEYARQFNIYFYNEYNDLYKTINVTENTMATYECIEQLREYKKIKVEILDWCKPYRRCKVVEVDFGIIKIYDDSSLIKVDLVQEIDLSSSYLPCDELKFTIDNSKKEFNPLNPQGYASYLQQGQEAFLNIGVELEEGKEVYEDIQVGKFYLKEQQSDEGTLTATFTCRDIFELLSNDEVENLTIDTVNLYDFIVKIFSLCGIENYKISNNLKMINTNGIYKKVSYRNLLQLVAIAGMCVVYSDNNGVVEFEQLTEAKTVLTDIDVSNTAVSGRKEQICNNVVETDKKYLTLEKNFLKLDGSFTLPENNTEIGWISNSLSNESGNFEVPLIVTLSLSKEQTGSNMSIMFDTKNNEYAAEFNIKAFNGVGELILNETITSNNNSIFNYTNNLLSSAKTVVIEIIKWCKSYRRARVVEIGFNLPVDHISFENMYAQPQIIINEVIKTVKVKFYPTDLDNPVECIYSDSTIENGNTVEIDNSLINSESHAIEVAKWIINNSKFNTFTVNYRGNPALNLADKLSIQNGYGFNNVINVNKHELTYQGYLSAKIEGKGL
jgi:hypothetical protein